MAAKKIMKMLVRTAENQFSGSGNTIDKIGGRCNRKMETKELSQICKLQLIQSVYGQKFLPQFLQFLGLPF